MATIWSCSRVGDYQILSNNYINSFIFENSINFPAQTPFDGYAHTIIGPPIKNSVPEHLRSQSILQRRASIFGDGKNNYTFYYFDGNTPTSNALFSQNLTVTAEAPIYRLDGALVQSQRVTRKLFYNTVALRRGLASNMKLLGWGNWCFRDRGIAIECSDLGGEGEAFSLMVVNEQPCFWDAHKIRHIYPPTPPC